MGFLDKAKESLASKFVDETVRSGNFEEFDENEGKPEKKSPLGFLKRKSEKKISESYDNDFSNEESQESSDSEDLNDLLGSMNIEQTFVIPDDVLFVDEDLANTSFSIQAPKGYDMGEVDFFVQRSQKSIAKYVELLRQRNNDVAKMARRILSLIDTNENLKFNAEAANGINIMASSDEDFDALQSENTQLVLMNKRLQEENLMYRSESGGESQDEDLRDQLSLVTRERNDAQAQLDELTGRLLYLEEELGVNIFADNGEISDEPIYSNNDGGFEESVEPHTKAEEQLYNQDSEIQSVGVDGVFTKDNYLDSSIEEVSLDDSFDEELPLDDSFDEELPLDAFEFNTTNDSQNEPFIESGAQLPGASEVFDDNDDSSGEGYIDENNNWIVNGEIRGFTDDEGFFREGYFNEDDEWVETAVYDQSEDNESESSENVDFGFAPENESSTISYDDSNDFEEELPLIELDEDFVNDSQTINSDFSDSAFEENPYQNLEEFIDDELDDR